MTTLYCAECEQRFEPDDDHEKLEVEHKRMQSRNETEEFVLCPECWREISEDWIQPV